MIHFNPAIPLRMLPFEGTPLAESGLLLIMQGKGVFHIENHKIPAFHIRPAEKKDASLIVKYIRDLASFEGELDQVTVTAKTLERNMFDQNGAQAIIGEYESLPVGFALYHPSFSTFLGQSGIALVDLYIEPEMRDRGFGKTMLAYLADLTIKQNCGRLEWWCHDWNAPAIEHYKKWGAFPIDNIRVYRLCGDALSQIQE